MEGKSDIFEECKKKFVPTFQVSLVSSFEVYFIRSYTKRHVYYLLIAQNFS